jgi:hypothetical protein
LYLKPVGNCGCSSIYLLSFRLICCFFVVVGQL